jgi:hypothetical protein
LAILVEDALPDLLPRGRDPVHAVVEDVGREGLARSIDAETSKERDLGRGEEHEVEEGSVHVECGAAVVVDSARQAARVAQHELERPAGAVEAGRDELFVVDAVCVCAKRLGAVLSPKDKKHSAKTGLHRG